MSRGSAIIAILIASIASFSVGNLVGQRSGGGGEDAEVVVAPSDDGAEGSYSSAVAVPAYNSGAVRASAAALASAAEAGHFDELRGRAARDDETCTPGLSVKCVPYFVAL